MPKSIRGIIMSNSEVYNRCYAGIEARESDANRELTDDEIVEEIEYTIRVNTRWIDDLYYQDDAEEFIICKRENIALKKLLSKFKQ